MITRKRIRAAGAVFGLLLAVSACGTEPTLPEEKGEDPKQPPPSEAMAPQAAPLFA
jgi:hypothetical protein